MSFLNQLKNQAKSLQVQQTEQAELIAERTAAVQKACDLLEYYLKDLARQLNVIQPPGPALSLDGKTPWPAMKLVDFRADSRRKRLRDKEVYDTVAIGWLVVPQVGKPVGGVVSVNFPPDMKRVVERLALGPVKHERKEIRDPEKNTLRAINFEYITETRGGVLATADHDAGVLHFRMMNTLGFELETLTYPATRINHDTLDELAKRIAGQPSRFA
jgi:hypothetical protein